MSATPAGELHVVEAWRSRLAAAGLDTLQALFDTRAGEVLSLHDRNATRRIALNGGEVVYLKVDSYTQYKVIAKDWLAGRRSEPLAEKERQGIARAAALGIAVPECIAWGQRRRWGRAWRGALVMAALAGVPLDEYLAARPAADDRLAALRAAGAAVRKLHQADLHWLDLHLRHVYVDAGPRIGLLDLERLLPGRGALRRGAPKSVRRFCRQLRDCGVDEAGLAAFLDELACGLRPADVG